MTLQDQNPIKVLTSFDHLKSILDHALMRVQPGHAIKGYVRFNHGTGTLSVAGREYNLNRYNKVFVVGGGKAARATALELVRILGTGSRPVC